MLRVLAVDSCCSAAECQVEEAVRVVVGSEWGIEREGDGQQEVGRNLKVRAC